MKTYIWHCRRSTMVQGPWQEIIREIDQGVDTGPLPKASAGGELPDHRFV